MLGHLPPPDYESATGEPRKTVVTCGTFNTALRRALATLLATERTGTPQSQWERWANEVSGVSYHGTRFCVRHPNSVSGKPTGKDEYETFN